MRPTWKDVTSYSQNDKDRTPRSWMISLGPVRLTVHRHIYHAPDAWLASCVPALLERVELRAKDIEAAKVEALDRLGAWLDEAATAVREAKGDA